MTVTNQAISTPIKVGNNHLKHRVVLAPLTRLRATFDNIPTDLHVEYYKQRASDGGLLISEGTVISASSVYPKIPGIYNKEQIEAWKKVTAAVHEKNGSIYLQIAHLGRAGLSKFDPEHKQIVSASAIAIPGKALTGDDFEVPRALEIDEIKEIVQQFRQAALNAVEAGFDGVEIHGANGFLVDQFINSSSNQRTDIYGGKSVENRARFPLEVIDAIVEAIGAERTAIRLSPGENHQDVHDDNVVETWSHLVSEIKKHHPNLSYLHFIEARVDIFSEEKIAPKDTLEPYRQIWKGPFIVASGYSNAISESVELSEKTGDLIAFGRAFIANPDLPERIRNGWELNHYDRSTFYSDGPEGYTDYPFYNEAKK